MARSTPDHVEYSESDEETYSGYNNFCAALTTADIEEHGIGVLCRNAEDPSPNTDTSLKWPRTPFPTHRELVQRRESFRGFRIKTESRWMKTPRGMIPRPETADWEVDIPPGIIPQSGKDFYMRSGSVDFPSGITSDTGMDYETMPGSSSVRSSTAGMTRYPGTECGTRIGTASSREGGSPTILNTRPGTKYGKRIGTSISFRPATPDRRTQYSMQDTPRPLSRIRAACYIPTARASTTLSSHRPKNGVPCSSLNPHGQPFMKEWVKSPLEEILLLEKQICELFVECREAATPEAAVKMAQDAQEKERNLNFVFAKAVTKFPYNTGLTFAVIMNLANQLEANEMYREALEMYRLVSSAKTGVFRLSFRAKINMGNMYVKLGKFPSALKFYHMALDQVPREFASYRAKILRNLGVVFFKTNQLVDAISAYTSIMDEKPTLTDGLNLMACLYALDCKEDMKTCFEMLLVTPLHCTKEDIYSSWDVKGNAQLKCLKDGLKFDSLGKLESKLKLEADKIILMSAQLVAKSICETIFDGYDWCIDRMKHSQFAHLVGEMQITKATKLMCEGQLGAAVELLKDLQRGGETAKSAAATNLAFIYLTQKDLDEADKYSAIACAADCYSSSALVNAGCCLLARGENALAKAKFTFAVENDALCFEALYDLGLVNKKMGLYVEANCCFSKLNAIFRDDALVLYHLATLHEATGDADKAMARYQQILCLEPRNALILKRVGKLFDQAGDLFQAHQYYLDSCRVLPSDVDVLIWLGIYNLNIGCPEEKAIKYINLAIQCQPHEISWKLMVASCHQRSGDLGKAVECYEEIHRQFPDNVDCLKRLVKMCMSLDNQKAKEYAYELKKLEKHKSSISNRVPSTPSSSTLSLCSQYPTVRSSPQMAEWHSQAQYEMKQPLIPVMYDIDSNSSTMIGEECYSCPYDGYIVQDRPQDRVVEDDLCTVQSNTTLCTSRSDVTMISHSTSLQRWECDDESSIDNSMVRVNPRYRPHSRRYCVTNNGGLGVKWRGVVNNLPVHTFYSDTSSAAREGQSTSIILPSKGNAYHMFEPQERRSVQCACAASDPVCSATHAQECHHSPLTPRMLFTKVTTGPVGGARCSVRMSDGDSRVDLHGDLQGQQHWFATPRVLSRECTDDLGLRMFSDSELGADLLPN